MKRDFWGRIEGDGDEGFQEVLNEQLGRWHTHSTNIQHFTTSGKEDAQQNENDARTEKLGKDTKVKNKDTKVKNKDTNGIPGGKVSTEVYVSGSSSTSSLSRNSCIFFLCLGAVVFVGMVIFAVLSNLGLL